MNTPSTQLYAVVADDDPEIRDLLTEYLAGRGFKVAQAPDGLEALRCVRITRPDLLILDLMMPRLGGVQALGHIRHDFPEVAVIVLTGTADDALRGRVVALGAAALLSKPLDLAVLGMIIDTVVTPGVETARDGGDQKTAPSPSPEEKKARVLVVDDEEEIRSMLRDFLESQHYQAILAEDGLAALQVVIDGPPPIVLLDISMARLGGIEALTAILAIAPHTKVIMISANDDIEVARRALAYGAFDYVRKPVDFKYLQTTIEAALSAAPA